MFVPIWLIIITIILLLIALISCLLKLNKIVSIIAGIATFLSLLGMFFLPNSNLTQRQQQTTNQIVQNQDLKASNLIEPSDIQEKNKKTENEKAFPWLLCLLLIPLGVIALIVCLFARRKNRGKLSVRKKQTSSLSTKKIGKSSGVIGK